jgi:hypothetical protein
MNTPPAPSRQDALVQQARRIAGPNSMLETVIQIVVSHPPTALGAEDSPHYRHRAEGFSTAMLSLEAKLATVMGLPPQS